MSGFNEDVWAEFASHSRRIIKLEQRMLERILALEAEVAALKGKTQPEDGRDVYEDAREINWCAPDAAYSAIARIMQRGDV
jgi:hypothetical protein